jgi:hypothetical protein
MSMQGRIQDIKKGGPHLKKLRRAEGGATIFGAFRVKNHDFTPKNRIFSNCAQLRPGELCIGRTTRRFPAPSMGAGGL